MVKFIKEIILKYLLGISKCTKLPRKKERNKQNNKLRTNTYVYIFDIFTSPK